METVQDVFDAESSGETPGELKGINITPELIEKIKDALLALEEVLAEAFPNNGLINKVLNFLATYVKWFWK